jgi:hypothetical protein
VKPDAVQSAETGRKTDAAVDAGPSVATTPQRELAVLFEGDCSAGPARKLGDAIAFVFQQSVVVLHDEGPKVLFRAKPWVNVTGGPNSSYLSDVGGIDEAHAWVIEQSPTRGGDTTSVPRFAALQWKTGPALSAAEYGYGYLLSNFIAQPDGSLWAFGDHDMYMAPGEPSRKTFAWSKDGAFLKVSLPGADMALGSRIENGEIVAPGRGKGGKPKLLRWSPRSPVDDLTIDDAPTSQLGNVLPILRVGSKTAVFAVPDGSPKKPAFYRYDGDKLVAVPVNAERAEVLSWFVAPDDTLYVATADLSVHTARDSVEPTRAPLPEAGEWVSDAGAPWWKGASGALYRREGNTWSKLTLPDSPWAKSGHPPYKVVWVRTIGSDTLIGARRTDVGYAASDKKPKVVTTVFSTGAPRPPMRCGYPLKPDELGPMP